MVTHLWLASDELTKPSTYHFSKFFCKYPPEIYSDWDYKERWKPFLKIQEGDNLIVRVGSQGFSNRILNRILKSRFNQKILILGEVPWRKKIKKIYNNLSSYLNIFDKIYTYIKPLTNNKNIFYFGSFAGHSVYKETVLNLDLINFDKKLSKICMILSEHSRREVIDPKKIIGALRNKKKLGPLFLQLINHPNAKFKFAGLEYNKLYGIRSQIARYFDKINIIDIYGRSGWQGTKNYKGETMDIWKTLFKYKWCLCIENNNINNYFSEKPMLAFLSGCIPIVLGGPYPSDVLPKGSYVDLRRFNYKNLSYYIQNEENYFKHSKILKKNYEKVLKQYDMRYKFLQIINTHEDLVFK
ncbi:MAG: glycosyltransferase family 10 domain-containing protein [Candidatus Hodarchaeota archaeon]